MTLAFHDIGRLPAPQDNCAIATRDLRAGTQIDCNGHIITLSHAVLVGHRFAIQPIARGENLLSWGQAFGVALRDITPGEYVCNEGVLTELGRRTLDFELPTQPNFADEMAPYTFDEANFSPADPLPQYDEMRSFMGYARDGGRGVGTRNMIVLLGTSSVTAGFVRALENHLKPIIESYENIDDIVAIAHTEGGHQQPNNRELLLRTLAGFVVHPNVGAVLALDYGSEAVTNTDLRTYLLENDYPLDSVIHGFMSLTQPFDESIAMATELIGSWVDEIDAIPRTPQPLSELKIALQCGGSDAFSGISGNPLAAWVAKEVIRYGGSANLAETDELIGAESYVLDKVRNAETVHKFLATVARFKERVAWHGQSAEGNPSGGNKYRGLYNIYLKSLGAAAKRHPDVPLEAVIDYSEPMTAPGFYFMDSPGNDLESIAGQVASGCNMIFFVTGNGSITNFPFVPTIKIVTTSARFELLSADMDVNAGLYLDGESLDDVGQATLDLTVDVASGEHSVGEQAGHSQVQIWRDWRQTHTSNVTLIEPRHYSGKPLAINADALIPRVSIPAYRGERGYTTRHVGLVLPTSLCSGQIAKMITEVLNEKGLGQEQGLSRFTTVVHTEGCGSSIVSEFKTTLLGYLLHPMVRYAMLLEHGCEITHNSYFRQAMTQDDINTENYGFASIQLDGGIQKVTEKVVDWFEHKLQTSNLPTALIRGLDIARVAWVTQGEISDSVALQLATITKMIVTAGGTVVVAENDALLESIFVESMGVAWSIHPTIGYGQHIANHGFHIMANPTRHWSETLSGLGATGVELMTAYVSEHAMSGHPMIPLLQVGSNQGIDDIDLILPASDDYKPLFDLIVSTLSNEYTPRVQVSGNVDFQITRGLLGVSL